jgi:hypothetical protein
MLAIRNQDKLHAKYQESKRWQGPNIPFIAILSAYLYALPNYVNVERHNALEKVLRDRGFAFKPVIGCYQLDIEQSFLVVLSSEVGLREVEERELAEIAFDIFHQDSILFSDRYRMTELLFSTGERRPIGQLVEASVEEAEASENWTYCPLLMQNFIVRPF